MPDLAEYVRKTLMQHEQLPPVWDGLDNEHAIIEATLAASQSDKVATLVQQIQDSIEDYIAISIPQNF